MVVLVQLERQDRRLGTKRLEEGRGAPRQGAPLPRHLGKPGAWRGALNTPRLTSWSCSRFSREVPTATKVVMVAGMVPVALPPSSERAGLDWEPKHGQRAGRKERNGFAGCRASHQGGVRIFPASPSANSLCWQEGSQWDEGRESSPHCGSGKITLGAWAHSGLPSDRTAATHWSESSVGALSWAGDGRGLCEERPGGLGLGSPDKSQLGQVVSERSPAAPRRAGRGWSESPLRGAWQQGDR